MVKRILTTERKFKKGITRKIYLVHNSKEYKIITTKKDLLTDNFYLNVFLLKCEFLLKPNIRGTSTFKNREFRYLTESQIYEIAQDIEKSQSFKPSNQKKKDNYNYMNKSQKPYMAGEHLFKSGLHSKLKTMGYTITRLQ